MTFVEALQAFKEGKMLVRKCWKEEDGYLTLLPGMRNCWKILTVPSVNAGNHIFNMEEMTAADWELYGWNDPVEAIPAELLDVAPQECAAA